MTNKSSSSTLALQNILVQGGINPPEIESLSNSQCSVGRIFIAKNIPQFKEIIPECSKIIATHEHRNIPSAGFDSMKAIKMNIDTSNQPETQKLGPKKFVSKLPSDTNKNCSRFKGIREKKLHKTNYSSNSTAHNKVLKEKISAKQMVMNISSLPTFLDNIHQNSSNIISNNEINLESTKAIRKQKVFLPELNEDCQRDNEETEIRKQPNKDKNISASYEQDPLFIPAVQGRANNSRPINSMEESSYLGNELTQKKLFVHFNNTNRMKNMPLFNGSETYKGIDETNHLNNFVSPLIFSEKSSDAKHFTSTNDTFQNRVPKTNNKKKIFKKNRSPPKNSKFEISKIVDSDLIYKNKLIHCAQKKSDNCRNFFIKNSAWDYLEPIFKGFNEREENISKSCSKYFRQLSDSLFEYDRIRHALSENDLYYTRKIELLDEKGRLDKVLYIPPQEENGNKKKSVANRTNNMVSSIKRCKIILERSDTVEEKVNNYLLKQKLNSNVLHHLSVFEGDVKKPLIILNKYNFGVLKITETLCNHANIMYVKDEEDEFPEKLFECSFLLEQIEKKIIKLISTKALRNYLT